MAAVDVDANPVELGPSARRGSTTVPRDINDDTWSETAACIAELHAPFDVTVTDEDPGDVRGTSGTAIAIIQVPARPFLAPVFGKYAQPGEVARRFLERVAAQLGGDFGRSRSTDLARMGDHQILEGSGSPQIA